MSIGHSQIVAIWVHSMKGHDSMLNIQNGIFTHFRPCQIRHRMVIRLLMFFLRMPMVWDAWLMNILG